MTRVAMHNLEPFVDCRDVRGNPARLQARAAANGYLYFPGMLPAADVLPVRHDVLQVADRHGLLRAGVEPDAGIRKEGVYIDLEYDKPTPPALKRFYNDILSLRSFNALPHLMMNGTSFHRGLLIHMSASANVGVLLSFGTPSSSK